MLTKRILKYVEENGEGEMISKKKLWNLLKLHEIAVREDEHSKQVKVVHLNKHEDPFPPRHGW